MQGSVDEGLGEGVGGGTGGTCQGHGARSGQGRHDVLCSVRRAGRWAAGRRDEMCTGRSAVGKKKGVEKGTGYSCMQANIVLAV